MGDFFLGGGGGEGVFFSHSFSLSPPSLSQKPTLSRAQNYYGPGANPNILTYTPPATSFNPTPAVSFFFQKLIFSSLSRLSLVIFRFRSSSCS